VHDGIAKIIEQLDVQQLWKLYKFYDHNIYPDLKYKRCNISPELFIIFTLIQEEKLILYGHKIIDNGYNRINTTHLSLQRIPKRFFTSCDIYSENSWTDNYSTVLNLHREYEYTNVSMKCEELDIFMITDNYNYRKSSEKMYIISFYNWAKMNILTLYLSYNVLNHGYNRKNYSKTPIAGRHKF
jgi:hypothetical protein